MSDCDICGGSGWICEACEKPFDESKCVGPGVSCTCNPDGDVDWLYVIATNGEDKSKLVN